MRAQPRPSLAWAIGIGYAILLLVLEKIVGIDYDKIGTTTDTIVKGIVAPVAIGALVLIVVTTLLGWWRPVLHELPTAPARPPRWLLAVPILVFVATLIGIDYGNLGDMGAAMIGWLALGTALVGFSEEITYRGLALVGFRSRQDPWRDRRGEDAAARISGGLRAQRGCCGAAGRGRAWHAAGQRAGHDGLHQWSDSRRSHKAWGRMRSCFTGSGVQYSSTSAEEDSRGAAANVTQPKATRAIDGRRESGTLQPMQTHERRATRLGRRSLLERQGAFGLPVFVLGQLSTKGVTVDLPGAPTLRPQRVRVFVDFWNFQLSANDALGRSFRPDWSTLSRWLCVEAAALISGVAASDLQFEGSTVYLSVGKGTGDVRLREWQRGFSTGSPASLSC